MEEKIYLLKELLPFFNFHQVQTFMTAIEKGLMLPDERNMFMATPNPIKQAVVIIDFNISLQQQFSFAKGKAADLSDKLTKMVNRFADKIENERDIEIMLKDTTYDGYEVLELITKHNLIDLLKSTVIDNVISSFWVG